jgi:hypothetical protein
MFGSLACLVSVVLAGMLLAQPPERPEAGKRGPRGGRRMDREQMRARMVERLKEQLGAKDEEWKVMEPRLQKVMDLSRQVDRPGRGAFFGRGGRRGAGQDAGTEKRPGRGPEGAPGRETTAVEKASDELQKVLDSESAKADEIKAKLTALREAREKAKQDLAKAQQDLKQILTVKQEAKLVLAGLLN